MVDDRLIIRDGLIANPASGEDGRLTWWLRPGSVVIEDGRIVQVAERIPEGGGKDLCAAGCLIIPALVNGHTHSFEYALKGFKSGRSIDDEHPEWFWRLYRSYPTELAQLSTFVHLAENLAAGVAVVQDVLRSDLEPGPFEAIHRNLGLQGAVYGADPSRAAFDLGHEAHASFPSRATQAAESPLTHMSLHLHYLETPRRRDLAASALGRDPTTYLVERGLMRRSWVLTHAGASTARDLQAFPRGRTTVVATPGAEARLGEPTVNPDQVQQAGHRLLIGTDGPCYNPRLDLFEEARALLRVWAPRPPDASAQLLAITTGQTGLSPGVTGGIQPGAAANLAILHMSPLTLGPLVRWPFDNVADNLLSTLSSAGVVGTVVAGRLLYWRGTWPQHDVHTRVAAVERRLRQFLDDTLGEETQCA